MTDEPRSPTVAEALAGLIDENAAGCWLWRGSRAPSAHRFVFELVTGQPLAGYVLRPLCETRRCINPAHFRRESYAEMASQLDSPVGRNMRATRCVRGHDLTNGENVLRSSRGRVCRACLRERARQRRQRERQAIASTS